MEPRHTTPALAAWPPDIARRDLPIRLGAIQQLFWMVVSCALVLGLAGRAAPTGPEVRNQRIAAVVADRQFSLLTWEIAGLTEKTAALVSQPARNVDGKAASRLVLTYLDDARRLGEDEAALNRLLSEGRTSADPEVQRLHQEIAQTRSRQASRRPTVEAILQRQVTAELAAAGFGVDGVVLPPVLFSFTEPPKKLVISPRTRIVTIYTEMLAADVDPLEASAREQAIQAADPTLSALITGIGGLGAYPTMVVDRASLPWILSTIAHEWVHNYLTLFPLGLRYGASGELTTINETVADIVGDEIGERVLRRYYPDQVPPEEADIPGAEQGEAPRTVPDMPPPFDFRREMRETRLRVDALLAQGLVETAEAYMEARRKFFVAHGYPIRVLNQAYFAFHGSYATGPASTSPIGPQLVELRSRLGDVAAFLHTVRWFTGLEDLERALHS